MYVGERSVEEEEEEDREMADRTEGKDQARCRKRKMEER